MSDHIMADKWLKFQHFDQVAQTDFLTKELFAVTDANLDIFVFLISVPSEGYFRTYSSNHRKGSRWFLLECLTGIPFDDMSYR